MAVRDEVFCQGVDFGHLVLVVLKVLLDEGTSLKLIILILHLQSRGNAHLPLASLQISLDDFKLQVV